MIKVIKNKEIFEKVGKYSIHIWTTFIWIAITMILLLLT